MHNHVQHASLFILTPPYAPPLRRTALALLLAGCFGAAQANPALPQVVNGQATFNQQGNIFSITNTPNTIINWQSFSIHAGEITRFIQQNGNSAVLNRITGQDPSKILGSLESNGKVFLINPNGIVFGQGAKVDVNGLVASSLGMTNEDFLAGKRQFTAGGVAGAVGNAGTINAGKGGQVLLIAPNVENTGIITAPNGEVILAAGRSVQLADPGNPQLRVLVSAPSDQALNLGQIIAQGGSIGMAGALVSQRGVLNANSAVVGEHGKIVLKASGKALLEAGSVTSATGAAGKGGDIQVLGEQVGLLGNAKVDASGATGGGTVLLGGDYQGKNAAVQNARQVLVGKDASVAADGIDSGNGGKVIAWGNESAQVHGSISARGGAQGGDGGVVETSGHYLAVDGIRVNTGAARGKRGNWLLDPYDINVVAGGAGQLGDVDQFADAPATGSSNIGADLISGASSNVMLQATHRINFNSAISMTQSGIGLTARAGETINVNSSITTNGGSVTLLANDASSGTPYGAGSIVNLAAPISTNGGSVALSGASVGGAGVVNVGSGNLALTSNIQDGTIDLTGSGDQLFGSGNVGQTVTLQADNIGINGKLNFGGTAGSANVIIKPLSSSRSIDLGTKSGTALGLNAVELAGISAASLTIGDGTNTAGIRISDTLARAGDLHLNSGSAITATSAVTVDGSFVLDGGNWVQNGAALPGFSARSFAIGSGASFLRVTGGDGASSPYLIADIYGLQGIASLGLGNNYRLAGNLDASGTVNWNNGQGFVPIGGGSGFSGVFDGGGFTLSNLVIDRSQVPGSAAGLFGTVQGGTLRNLILSGGSVAGTANVGALAGNVVSGTIENVNSSVAVSGQRNVGGLVGSNGGAVTMSSSSGAVTGVNADGGGAIGGLAGWNASGASIATSYATGVVTGAREMIGGLVGNNQGALSQSYATGNVSGARSIGGLVGLNGGSIDDAYASGAVGRAATADPILTRENMGGLVGESTGSVSHVFSSGAVTGDGYADVGAVAGRVSAGSPFSYGFFNYETSLVQAGGGGSTGLSTAQMRQQASFNDYNFSSVWRIYEGYTTPMLKAFLKPLQVNLSGNAAGKVYDGQLAAFLGSIGYVGLLDGDTGVNGSLGYGSNARNVGSYAATGLWSTKYDITLGGTTTFAITPRALTVSIGGNGKVYDGTLGYDGASFVLGNLVTGDNISASGSAAFLDKNVGGSKAVHASGLALVGNELGNYSLTATTADGTAAITARLLNYGVSGAQSRVYDGTLQAALNGYFEGLATGDQVGMEGLQGSFRDKNVGTGKTVDYQVSTGHLTGADAGNYVLNGNAGSTTADITARTLNVNISGVNKTYDGTTGAQVNFGDDRIQGDVLTVAGNAAFGNKNAGTGKAVNVTNVALSGGDAGNYVLGSNAGSTTADIAARTLNVSFNGVNKTYDGTTGAQVGFGDDRIQGDTLSVSGSAAFGNRNAGTGKTVNVTNVALSGGDAGNYMLGSNVGSTTADIAARTLNVSFNGVNKTYDGTTGAQVSFGDDRIQGDVLTVAGNAAFGNKNAGAGKAVNVSNVGVSGTDAGNYVLSSNAGSTTSDIGARALNLSGVAGGKVYDGTTAAQLSLGDDRVAGDILTASAVANFADKNVGAGKAVQLSGATVTGADAGNYFIVLPTGLLASITPASLTLAGVSAAGKVYDGTTSATVSASANGVLGQDVVSVVGGSGSFADKNAGAGKLVTASGFRLAGADAGNYTLETTGGTAQASIAQKQLSTWVGSGNGLWSDAANWDGGVVPEGSNVLAVDFSNSKGTVTYSAAAGNTILKNLNSATGLLLTGGSLTLGESALDRSVLGGLAGLEINGGSLLLNGSLSADRYAQGGGLLSGNGNLLIANSFNQTAGAIRLAGQLAITQAAGDLRFASLAANTVQLSALNGAIAQDGALLAGSVAAQARDGIVLGNAGNQVGSFTASNSAGGGIALNNTSAPGTLTLGTLVTGAGNIAIDNTGGVAAGNINANGGNVSVTAHSPVTVNGKIAGNDITLNASTDVLLGDGAQLAAARDISVVAGGDIRVGGNATIAGAGNFSAIAGTNVRFADTASVTLPAAGSIGVLAKTGSITGDAGVRVNRQRSGVTLLAPNGAVNMADAIFLPATTIDKPVIDTVTSAAIDDALRIIKQADRANDALASTSPTTADDKKKDSKEVAGATDKPTGYKFDEPTKKMYCN
ncbi:filamentous hemagglutinin family protein [Janthinobacterium sp. 67]|uniref:YDG domain-containing protein n=1 Tax=Janthinobacterium sp. 67 TaxID=2035207 RepID=UPI000CC60651|nr:YDG domain-containing protein [Janthinobacterium sp. 67]PJJ19069.1 filamentous hemagglutinin family protein [Janthinobacterium sp. 67]